MINEIIYSKLLLKQIFRLLHRIAVFELRQVGSLSHECKLLGYSLRHHCSSLRLSCSLIGFLLL